MREPVEVLFPAYGRAAYRVLKLVIGGTMKTLYTIRTEGLHNVPATGPAILAANHISFLDSFFIPLAVPRRVTYLAKAEYWDSWKTRWFFEAVGQIPVRRDDSAKAQSALEQGVKVLSNQGLLGIYPEGTRSPDGRLYRGKTGPARMARRAGVPIVPIGLIGTREVMPKDAKLPSFSGEVTIRFGQPLHVPDGADEDPMVLRSFTDRLMYEIAQLSGQEYVDSYAGRGERREPVVPAPEPLAGTRV